MGVTRRVCVLALDCKAACVRQLAASLETPLAAQDLQRAFRTVQDGFPRDREILSEALEVMSSQVRSSAEEPTLFALYSIPEVLFRLIM
ncbi:hypothetical protein EVAR_10679_1 [Eumeta japonica]|uniref:Uncharacterized protein n=1 Tax=Eumeta variegata TaxID=151549 RepID=A0A4C1U773_EUMVA|nr:hypothetical protein EVAR_10679_1 [Eumeta japonica]